MSTAASESTSDNVPMRQPRTIEQIFNHSVMPVVGTPPILQVLDVTQVEVDRYRLVLSDGKAVAQALLESSLGHLVATGQIKVQAMLSLDEYVCSMINDTRFIIVLRAHTVVSTPAYEVPILIPTPTVSNAFIAVRSLGISSSYRYWSIRCRIILKSAMRSWKNEKGDGHCFSVDLIDKDGDTIRATMFNAVADELYDVLHINHIYVISVARIQVTNKKYNPLSHPFQLTIENANQIASDTAPDDGSIPMQQFTYMKINVIVNERAVHPRHIVDFIGVVILMQDVVTIRSPRQEHGLRKRQLTVMDETGHIDLTLWGNNVNITESTTQQLVCPFVISIKNANVTEFKGQIMIGTTAQSQVCIDPLIQEAELLKHWYTHNGAASTVIASSSSSSSSTSSSSRPDWHLASRTTLASITENRLGQDKVDWITVRVTVITVGHDIHNVPYYSSCPVCTKKVIQDIAGWYCDSCNQSYLTPLPRYVLNVQCADASGTRWITAFDEVATKILGNVTAMNLMAMRLHNDPTNYQTVLQGVIHKQFFFRVRLKRSDVMDDSRRHVRALAIDLVETQYDIRTDHTLSLLTE